MLLVHVLNSSSIGRCAGDAAAAVTELAHAAVNELLLPLLGSGGSAVTAARRSELAADVAGLLVSLRMWSAAADLTRAAAAATCRGLAGDARYSGSGSGGAAAVGLYDSVLASLSLEDDSDESEAGSRRGIAAETIDEELRRLEAPLTLHRRSGTNKEQAANDSRDYSRANGTETAAALPAEAALPLLCQLVAAAAGTASGAAGGRPSEQTGELSDNTPSASADAAYSAMVGISFAAAPAAGDAAAGSADVARALAAAGSRACLLAA